MYFSESVRFNIYNNMWMGKTYFCHYFFFLSNNKQTMVLSSVQHWQNFFSKVLSSGICPGQINYDGPMRNTEHQVDQIYYTLFCRCTALLRLLPDMVTCAIRLSQKHFPESNRSGWISFIHFYCAGSHTEHRWRCSYPLSDGPHEWG